MFSSLFEEENLISSYDVILFWEEFLFSWCLNCESGEYFIYYSFASAEETIPDPICPDSSLDKETSTTALESFLSYSYSRIRVLITETLG